MPTDRSAGNPTRFELPASFPCKGLAANKEEMARRIADDLQRVMETIRGTGKYIDAVLLSGSLGRDEATVVQRGGEVQLLSDYDLFVVTDAVSDFGFFRGLESPLAERLWGPHASIGLLSATRLPTIPASVWSYDVRYGSRILEGDPATLERMPSYASEDIPTWEGLKLAFNYSGVLLAALDAADLGASGLPADTTELRSSVVRLAHRLGDMLTLLEGRYHHLLSRRRELVPTLCAFESLGEADRRLIAWGYDEKLRPQAFWTFDLNRALADLFLLVERLLRYALQRYLGYEATDLPALLAEYRRRFPAASSARARLRTVCARLLGQRRPDHPTPEGSVDRFHYVLSLVPLALLGSSRNPGSASCREETCRLLGAEYAGSGSGAVDARWCAARVEVLRLWKTVCL
jgi:hypothetical protein